MYLSGLLSKTRGFLKINNYVDSFKNQNLKEWSFNVSM
jgi:hypothetical protein